MIEALKKKMSNYEPITDKEMRFMLQNIGHVNPEIRDDLIYGLFCIGLEKEMFSIHQVKEIIRYLSENNLLFQGLEDGMIESTLRRSFTALIWALFLYFEDKENSVYFRLLSQKQRENVFEMSIEHLSKERDATGYLKPYGWVHTIAHSSELLLRAVCHSMFQKELAEPVLNAVAAMFMKQENVFSDREEKRVGLVLLEMLESKKLSVSQFKKWIEQMAKHYDTEKLLETKDFRSKENVVNMLNYVLLYMEEPMARELRENIKQLNSF